MNDGLVSFNKQELLLAIQHDCIAFFGFFMGEDLDMEIPDFHEQIWHELLEAVESINQHKVLIKLKKLFAVPRGFAKTTVAKLAVILLLKYTRFAFVLYASKTTGHGKNAIRDIIFWLTSPQYKALHGELIQIKADQTEAVWIFDMPIRDPRTMEVAHKRIIFKAVGAASHIRGFNVLNKRPEIIVIDDIEDNDNTTPELQPKLDEWFLGAFFKSFATSYFAIFIGNMIRETTLLARFTKDPDWNPTVFGCIVRNKETGRIESLWEEKFPLAELLKEYRSFRALGQGHVWEVEMMNLTQDEIFALTMETAIRPPTPDPSDLEAGVIIVDPKFGTSAFTDDTAISVHGRIKGLGIPAVIEVFTGKIVEEQIFDKLLELSYYWGITTWVIEADAAQRILIPYFTLLMQDRRINPSVFAILPVFTDRKAKPVRITAMKTAIAKQAYAVCEDLDHIVDGFANYKPTQKKDDDVDSVSHGLTVWTAHGTSITEKGIIKQLFQIAHDHTEDYYDSQSEAEIASF